MASPPTAMVEWVASQGGVCIWPNSESFEVDGEPSAKLMAALQPVSVDAGDYDAWWSVFSDPFLWFVNHKIWDITNSPDFRAEEHEAYERHLEVVQAVVAEIAKQTEGPPIVHGYGYRLLFASTLIRRTWPDAEIHQIVPTAWGDPSDLAILPYKIRDALFEALTNADSVTFPTPADARRFMRCCEDFYELDVDLADRRVKRGGVETRVHSQLPPADVAAVSRRANTAPIHSLEEELIVTRRQYMLLTTAQVDPSANLLRGLTALDTLLTQSPQHCDRITYRLLLWVKTKDIPEYAEYLERIEALVAVVNQRHGKSDWMPIDLRIFFNIDHILAALRQFDLLFLPTLKEGANAIPQIAAAVNQRNGVIALSREASSSERFAPAALTFHPFDIVDMKESLLEGLNLSAEERARRAAELRVRAHEISPDDWLQAQIKATRGPHPQSP